VERRWKILSIRGIPIYVTVAWLFFAAFVVWATYATLAATSVLTHQEAIGWSIVNAFLFYGSIVIHELSHAFVARAYHLPVRGITLVFWGGYTEIDPADRGPLTSFLISAAGPFSTLALAGIFWAGGNVIGGVLGALLRNLAFLSLLFAGLNALPGFPVDGGRMLLAAVWGITHDRFRALKVAGGGGVAVGAVLGFAALQRLRSRDGDWVFLAFIAWMMIGQGLQVARQAPVLERLSRGRVADAMRPPPAAIPADATLLQALDTHLRDDRSTEFPVVDADGGLIGSLSFTTAAKIGGSDPTRRVTDAMTPRLRVRVVRRDLPLDRALEVVAGSGQALVIDGDRAVGRLSASDVDRWYAAELGGGAVGSEPETIPPRPDLPGRGVGGAG
jgi:Zn-dependent protease